MDELLDYVFVVLHGGLVVFNLTGWAFRRTRRFHLVTICLTLLSWFVLGIFYGIGYCPLTDWHWQVKERLGEIDLPNSYLKYYADQITGFSWSPMVLDMIAVVSALSALLLSCWLNWRDHRNNQLSTVV